MDKMERVIERLRTSKARKENPEHSVGFKMGKLWAEDKASFEELSSLELGYSDQMFSDNTLSFGEAFCRTIGIGPRDAFHFWCSVSPTNTHDRMDDKDFVWDFGAGAIHVWNKVKGHL
jgi:hypothetical protein